MHCYLRLGLVFPPMDRLEKSQQTFLLILPHQGAIAAPRRAARPSRKTGALQEDPHERHQWGLASQWKLSRESLKKWVKLTPLAALHMKRWFHPQNTLKGVIYIPLSPSELPLHGRKPPSLGAYLASNLQDTVSISGLQRRRSFT